MSKTNAAQLTPEEIAAAEAAARAQAQEQAEKEQAEKDAAVAQAKAAAEAAAKPGKRKGKTDAGGDDAKGREGKVMVTVIGPAEGRRRAGFSFGPNPSVVAVTADQLEILKGDGLLSVSEGRVNASATAELEAKGGEFTFAERLPVEAYKGKITVIGPGSGRRRAGRTFGKEPVTFKPSQDELAAILADAALSVSPA